VIGQSILERDDDAAPGLDLDDDDYEGTDGIDFRLGRRAGPRWPKPTKPPFDGLLLLRFFGEKF
jgi:hypothetical protein